MSSNKLAVQYKYFKYILFTLLIKNREIIDVMMTLVIVDYTVDNRRLD